MAGKTGLNISHAEPVEQFIGRYDQAEWLAPWIREWDANMDSSMDERFRH